MRDDLITLRYSKLLKVLLCVGYAVTGSIQPGLAAPPAFHWPGAPVLAATPHPQHQAIHPTPLSATPISSTLRINPSPSTAYANAGYVDRLVRSEMKTQGIPGLSIAIVQNSKLVYTAGYGLADRNKKIAVSPGTLFNLASVSKPITAVAVLQLAERGQLDINAPVQKYVPTFPQKKWPITCTMLLGHLAGIRHYRGVESLSSVHYTDVIAPLAIFQNDPLVHQPRTAYLYSSYGYNLLGAALQGASGQPFLQYMNSHIFTPAGMRDVRVYDGSVDSAVQAVGYQKTSEGGLQPSASFDATNKIPSGGFVTSAPDVARFMIALFNNKLISKSARELMWTRQKLSDGSESTYGMGWFIGKWRGNLRASHGGNQRGFTALLYALPDRDFAVVILTNLSDAKLYDLAREIRGMVF